MWLAPYVLADVGTAAVMGVPGHDSRDKRFADTFGLPQRTVLARSDASDAGETVHSSGTLLDGLPAPEARAVAVRHLLDRGLGRPAVTVRPPLAPARTHTLCGWADPGRGGHAARTVPPPRLARLPAALLGRPHPDGPLHDRMRRTFLECSVSPVPALTGQDVYHARCLQTVPVDEADLPVRLPEGLTFTGRGGSPLAQAKDWLHTTCPKSVAGCDA